MFMASLAFFANPPSPPSLSLSFHVRTLSGVEFCVIGAGDEGSLTCYFEGVKLGCCRRSPQASFIVLRFMMVRS